MLNIMSKYTKIVIRKKRGALNYQLSQGEVSDCNWGIFKPPRCQRRRRSPAWLGKHNWRRKRLIQSGGRIIFSMSPGCRRRKGLWKKCLGEIFHHDLGNNVLLNFSSERLVFPNIRKYSKGTITKIIYCCVEKGSVGCFSSWKSLQLCVVVQMAI